MIIVEIADSPPAVVVKGLCVQSAPTVQQLYEVLDRPGRIYTGETPAPVGYRNNQVHVYDELGLVFHEHHYTRRVENVWCWFDTEDPPYAFTPKKPFQGKLLFNGVAMPLGGLEREYFRTCPFRFAPQFGHVWVFKFDGYSLFANARAPKSGRRSKRRKITDISISWPHDPCCAPATEQ